MGWRCAALLEMSWRFAARPRHQHRGNHFSECPFTIQPRRVDAYPNLKDHMKRRSTATGQAGTVQKTNVVEWECLACPGVCRQSPCWVRTGTGQSVRPSRRSKMPVRSLICGRPWQVSVGIRSSFQRPFFVIATFPIPLLSHAASAERRVAEN